MITTVVSAAVRKMPRNLCHCFIVAKSSTPAGKLRLIDLVQLKALFGRLMQVHHGKSLLRARLPENIVKA